MVAESSTYMLTVETKIVKRGTEYENSYQRLLHQVQDMLSLRQTSVMRIQPLSRSYMSIANYLAKLNIGDALTLL